MLKQTKLVLLQIVIFSILICSNTYSTVKKYNIGYFEAGKYDVNSQLRNEYFKQLESLLPDTIQLISIPEGYKSADWNRTTCKKMAQELTANKNIDFLIAVGPWVLEDLLEAGFKKPIIGMHQFNPKAQGLLVDNDRPIVDNLTVHFRPGKTFEDIAALTKLIDIKRLGVLSFPTDDTVNSLYKHMQSLGEQYGFSVHTAEGFDNEGTYAFYKAYNTLKSKRVDAIYLGPLFGLNSDELTGFFEMLNRDRVPCFVDEGALLVQLGATITNSYFGIASEAYFSAYKTIQIINGAVPADLPVIFRGEPFIALNKKSAEQCKVELRTDIINNYMIVGDGVPQDISISPLNEIVHRAINQNPSILSLSDKLDAVQADIDIAKSLYKPQLSGESRLGVIDNNFQQNYQNYIDKNIFRSSLHLTQTLFSKEKLKEIKHSKEIKKITELQNNSDKLDLEETVSLAYLDILKFQEYIAVIQNIQSMLSYNIELLYAKQKLNENDSLAVLRLENFRYSFTLDFIENRHLLKTAQIILNSLLNLPPDEKILLDQKYFSEESYISTEAPLIQKLVSPKAQNEVKNKFQQIILSQNPNQLIADAEINLQKSSLEKAKSSMYPELQLEGSLYYDKYRSENLLYKEKNPSWYIGGKLSLPLYLGGKRLKEKQKAQALVSEAEYKKDEVSLQNMKNGLTDYYKFLQYTEQMTPAYLANQRAIELSEIVNQQLFNDDISISDYLDIIEKNYQTNIASINTRFNYYASMAKLINDLGIGVTDSFSDFIESRAFSKTFSGSSPAPLAN